MEIPEGQTSQFEAGLRAGMVSRWAEVSRLIEEAFAPGTPLGPPLEDEDG